MTLEGVLDKIIIVFGRALVGLGELLEDIFKLALDDCPLADLLGCYDFGVGHVLARECVFVVVAEVSDQLHQVVALLSR